MISLSEFLVKPQKTLPEPSAKVANSIEPREVLSEPHQIPLRTIEINSSHRIVLLTDPRSPGADRFRLLRMCLKELSATKQLRRLIVTSPLPKDGKTTVAINLATALAEYGKNRVLLIDGDLHCPSVSRSLNIENGPGLAECLEYGLEPLSAIVRLTPLQIYLLQSGESHNNPTELVQSDSFKVVLDRLSPYFDWIVIDTPPLAPLSDALLMSRHADASLLVVRANETPKKAVGEALSVLGPNRVAGIILNGSEGINTLYSKYSGYYGVNKKGPKQG